MAIPEPWQVRMGKSAYTEHLRITKVSTRELARILLDAAVEGERIVNAGVDPRVGARIRRAQLSQSVLALRQLQQELWPRVGTLTQEAIRRVARIAGGYSTSVLSYLIDKGLSPEEERAFRSAMMDAARNGAEQVRSRLLNDIPLADRVYRNRTVAEGKVQRIVNQGLALNKSAKEIAADVRHLINPRTPGGISYAAMRLARTEINNAFHATTIRSFANQPWVVGAQWNLSGSHPRPDICDDYAERGIYLPKDIPSKPHPHCFCYVTMVTMPPRKFERALINGDFNSYLAGNRPF